MKKTKIFSPKIFIFIVGFVLLSFGFCKDLYAQEEEFGTISGRVEVKDEQIRYLKDKVSVLIYNQEDKKFIGRILLNKEGEFSYGGLSFGSYVVRFQSDGYGSTYYKNAKSFDKADVIILDNKNYLKDDVNVILEKGVEAKDDVTIPADVGIEVVEKREGATEREWTLLEKILIAISGVLAVSTGVLGGVIYRLKKNKNNKVNKPVSSPTA